jgi:hypothetical protein
MKKEAGALLSAGCIAAIMAVGAIGTANAAIVPFKGIEYSYLATGDSGPYGDWIEQIDDLISVRTGDSMQFRNRWYNAYAGTADIRISYGGGFKYTCVGADEYVYYGLNYGNYYPSGTDSVPFYSTVTNCSPDEPYYLVVNHQYVYNGIMYGCDGPGFKWTVLFQKGNGTNVAETVATTPEPQDNTPATATPVATPAVTPAVTGQPMPSPGFSFDAIILLAGAFSIVCSYRRYIRR